MAQPIKKSGTYQKPRSKTVKKKKKPSTSEIIKKNIERSKKPHPKYGTSKLEKKFAKEILEKLGVKYEEQFEAKDIKRYFDFFLSEYGILIECDGDFYHSYGKVYEEMSPMQKRNHRVDEIKNACLCAFEIPLFFAITEFSASIFTGISVLKFPFACTCVVMIKLTIKHKIFIITQISYCTFL